MERLESNHGFVVRSGSVSGWIGLYRTQQPDAMAGGAAPLRKRHGSASPFAEAFVGGHGRHGAVENVTRQALWARPPAPDRARSRSGRLREDLPACPRFPFLGSAPRLTFSRPPMEWRAAQLMKKASSRHRKQRERTKVFRGQNSRPPRRFSHQALATSRRTLPRR